MNLSRLVKPTAVAFVVIASLHTAQAADVPAGVTLSSQRVRLDAANGRLDVEVIVHNNLDVALSAVEVGWLLAASAEELDAVRDPGPLYLDADDPKHAAPPPGTTVLRRRVTVAVPAKGQGVATFAAEAPAKPTAVYRTHVLGYALADASLPLLLRLLNGSAAADERAAVDFFAIADDARARLAARQRLAGAPWANELATRVLALIPQRPGASELHERIYAVRALGVVGGARAEEALTTLRDRTDLAAFDDFVRIVLIDRLRGTRLETPLAFAVPPGARSMRDIVDAALSDARSLDDQAQAFEASKTAVLPATNDLEPVASDPPPREPPQQAPPVTPKSWPRRAFPWLVCAVVFVVTLRLLRPRSR